MSSALLWYCCKFSMKIIFYLPVNTDRPKFVAFLVFVCMTSLFITQISSIKNVLKQDAILAPVAKQWIAKDILSYESQSKCALICALFTDLVNTKTKFGRICIGNSMIIVVIFGINTTSDISKLLYVISQAVRRVKFETILKFHEWYLRQISRTKSCYYLFILLPAKGL